MKKPLGDRIESNRIVHAVGKAIGCVDEKTGKLKPDSTCAKVRDDLNEGRYADAFYDRFFDRARKKNQTERDKNE